MQIAADHGIADGQCFLGVLYENGNGVAKDVVSAYEWMTLATRDAKQNCTQGVQSCSEQIKGCTRQIELLTPQMTDDQIAEANRRAAVWSPKPRAQFDY
jgi:hypothetical protein